MLEELREAVVEADRTLAVPLEFERPDATPVHDTQRVMRRPLLQHSPSAFGDRPYIPSA